MVEDSRPSKQVVDIRLKTELEDIPEGPPCPACGKLIKKIFLEHTSSGDNTIVHAENAAGYQCEDCDISLLSSEAAVESLSASRVVMLENNDPLTANSFEQAIEKQQAIIDTRRLSESRTVVRLYAQEDSL